MDRVFLDGLLEQVEDAISEDNELLAKCASPIERRFAAAFQLYAALLEGRPWGFEDKAWLIPRLFIEPQFEIKPYRVDFLIGWKGAPLRDVAFVVECDGHEFHEKTKEQAAHDKSRDRVLSARVARVLRFTGSEIHRKPFECASEAFGIADGLRADYRGQWKR